LYAKNGAALTLTVTTSTDTKCVDVSGIFTAHQQSNTAKQTWTFTSTAGAGDGIQTANVSARPNLNQNNCGGQNGNSSASYVLDNTGPVVTGAIAPPP